MKGETEFQMQHILSDQGKSSRVSSAQQVFLQDFDLTSQQLKNKRELILFTQIECKT